jgi:hypothetical protein
MKFIPILILCGLFANPCLSHAEEESSLELVNVKPQVAFTPKGFDVNDNAQVVLYGKYHDICHKTAPVQFTIDRANHSVTIENRAYQTKICSKMFVTTPYTTVVNLGTLSQGTYAIYVKDESGNPVQMATLPISVAKNPGSIDNFIYAKVDEVHVLKSTKSESLPIVLSGTLNNTCLTSKEVTVTPGAGNVYDVLPILNLQTANCQPTEVPYSTRVTLKNFPSEPTLLNIRSMGGQSIERVIDHSLN